jgi:hypothetical protein
VALSAYSPTFVEREFSEVHGSKLPRPDRGLGDRDGAERGYSPKLRLRRERQRRQRELP